MQQDGVLSRHDEQVAACDRLDVHEGDDQLVLVHEAGRFPAGHDLTEDAVVIGDKPQG